ncbi:MAG: hypothetical protein HN337_07835 [Deltaproteobacteria bacterium]|jgi:hypothetical protein|nr:hypothetical protein [Deltaproteobacteria bacterium]
MDTQLLTIVLIIVGLILVSPYVITWRMKRFGEAIIAEGSTDPVIYSSWTTLKGATTLTKQSILCRFKLYSDRVGMRLLWGPERFIKFSDIKGIQRLLRGPRTTALKLVPQNTKRLHEIFIKGITDIPLFLKLVNSHSDIECSEMEDDRTAFGFLQ